MQLEAKSCDGAARNFRELRAERRTVQLGARSWAAEGKAQLELREKTAPAPFYKRGSWKLSEASWRERAEPKVQLEGHNAKRSVGEARREKN